MPFDLSQTIKERTFRDLCAEELFVYYKGDTEELKPIVFPPQDYLAPDDYAILMGFFAYVNLCKPSVNRIVSGVYGNPVKRTVEPGSPYKDDVDRFLEESRGYSLKCREWFKSGVLYGPGIQVFVIGEDEEVHSWLPNPVRTEIVTNDYDVTDIEAIVEEVGPRKMYSGNVQTAIAGRREPETVYRFVTKYGWGVANKSGDITSFAPHGLGIVPAVIAYGENTLMYGEPRGRSLVKSSPQFSKVVTLLLLNQVALIMNNVRPQAVASGEVKNTDDELADAFGPKGVLHMGPDGKFMFVTPNTNFKDLTSTIDSYKANYCISEGIPLDALDPANMPENQSATSARLRNQPMSVTINRLVEEQKTNEILALTIVGALYQMIRTGQSVTFSDFQKRFKCSVHIEPSGAPESLSELAAAWVQLQAMGAYTAEDIIRRAHSTAGESEIQRRVKEYQAAQQRAIEQFNRSDSGNPNEPKSDSRAEENAA